LIEHCTFRDNAEAGSQGGGAVRCIASSPIIRHTLFTGNRSNDGDGGGALYCAMGSTPQVDTCRFIQNFTGDQGGAVYCDNSTPAFTGCLFQENTGVSGAGAIEMDGGSHASYVACRFVVNQTDNDGGAVQNWKSSPSFDRCQFIDNAAGNDGGGLFNYNECSPWVSNTLFQGNSADQNGGALYNRRDCNPVVVNCLMTGNSAGQSGGGIYTQLSNSLACNPNVTNTTITQNIAGTSGGGAYDDGAGDSKLWNSIVFGNSAPVGPDVEAPSSLAVTALRHSIIGSEYYETGTTAPSSWSGQLFVNASGADFHLAPNSPAIDLGDSTVFDNGATPDLSGYTVDLDGLPRTMGWTTDLGAFESCGDTSIVSASVTVLPSDTVDSGTVLNFNASIINASVLDSFAWQINGTAIIGGSAQNLALIAGVDVMDGDEVSYWYQVGDACVAHDTGSSTPIVLSITYPVDTSDTGGSGTGVGDVQPSLIRAYPNPCRSGEPITFVSELPIQALGLRDLNGRMVRASSVAPTTQWILETEGLPAGIYVLTSKHARDGTTTLSRIILTP
jgi:predicted outer membrane repeat protein